MKTLTPGIRAALALGLLARLLCGFVFTSWHASDAEEYIDQAHAILRGAWLTHHPNGYPLLIAIVARVTGERHLDVALLLVNMAVSTITILLAAALASRMGVSEAGATAAAFVCAFWPNQLQQAQNIGADVPATFFLVLAVLLLSSGRGTWAGLAAGAGAACRPSLVAAIVLLAAAAWRCRGGALRFTAAAAVPLVLVMALAAEHGVGWTLDGHVGEVVAIADQSFGGAMVATGADMSARDALRAYVRRAEREPGYFLRQRLASLWEMWGSWPFDNGRGAFRQLALGIRFPLVVAAVIGWFTRPSNPAAVYAAVAIVGLTLVHVALFSIARFAVPMEPLAIALAAGGLDGVGRGRTDTPCGTGS